MNNFLPKLSTKVISGVTILALVCSIAPVQAQVKFKLPDLGAPGRRVPGGSRGQNCIARSQRLTALIPKSNISLTTLSNPTLYFYIPQNQARQLELVITDEEDQQIYKQNYKSIGNPGVVGISLPMNTLKKSQTYRWSFSIICNTEDRSLDKLVNGAIERVNNSTVLSKVEEAKPQERLSIYAEAGIWQDLLDTLAKLRYSNPYDTAFKADWESLLMSQGIEFDKQLAQAPLAKQENVMQQIN